MDGPCTIRRGAAIQVIKIFAGPACFTSSIALDALDRLKVPEESENAIPAGEFGHSPKGLGLVLIQIDI
jgi:hypothetical protein